MDNCKALRVVSALANGVNPLSGEMFDMDSPYQSADVIQAMHISVKAIEFLIDKERKSNRLLMPANAGKKWTDGDDAKLLRLFDEGRTVVQLAREFERTTIGIEARLERLERLPGGSSRLRFNRRLNGRGEASSEV